MLSELVIHLMFKYKGEIKEIFLININFEINFIRGGSTWRPHVTATGSVPSPNQFGNISPVTRTSLAHKQPEQRPIGTGYNNAARPFNGVSIWFGLSSQRCFGAKLI